METTLRQGPAGAYVPPSIGIGEIIECSISSSGEVDTYTFTASAGDTVLVKMSRSSGDLHPGIRVYDPAEVEVCEEINSPVTTMAQISGCSLVGGGTYTIAAFDVLVGARTGGYYLYLQRLNNPGGAAAIGFGQTLPGTLLTPAQVDTYTFTASAGDTVLVRMSRGSGDLHPGIRVYNPAGEKVCEAINSPVTTIAQTTGCTLPSGGNHTILVFDDYLGTRTGDYHVYLQRLNNPGAAAAIGFGQTLPGTLLTPAQVDTYTFAASAGDKVLVRMGRSSGDLHPGIRVYDPAGEKVCEKINSPMATMAQIASCTLAGGGSYTILVFDDYLGTRAGGYYVYLQRLNNPGNAVPIQRGSVYDGTVVSPAQMDTYTFSVTDSDQVEIRIRRVSGSFWPGLEVYDLEGTKICEAGESGAAVNTICNLPGAGAYTILAFDSYNGTYTGDYRLYLDCCRIFLPLTKMSD